MAGEKRKNISLNANNALKESCKFSLKFAIKKLPLVVCLKIKKIYT